MDSGLKRAGFIVGALWVTPVRLVAAAVTALIFAAGTFAQDTQTAYVPFVVNVDAAVMAEPLGDGSSLPDYPQVTATAGEQAILRIPLPKTNSVINGTQRQLNVPAVVSNRNGKVSLNLPAQSYKNAEVSLYNVNGKRILRKRVSALGAANNISRQGIATGAYLLSIREVGGNAAITSRITHSGGGLNISVEFRNESENKSSTEQRQLTKRTDAGEWRITVTAAAGAYIDSVYTFRPVAGTNPPHNITLREAPLGTYLVRISSIGTGATNSGYYLPGTRVNITAGTAPTGYRFKKWTAESGGIILADANSAATSFIMPENAVVVTAVFEEIPVNEVKVISEATDATGGGNYAAGTTVNIKAGTPPVGRRFKGWTTESEGVTFANANNAATSFVMPENAVEVTAVFEANTFKVTVFSAGMGALGGGDYSPGATVSISAGTLPSGYTFKNWISSNRDVIFADVNGAMTTFIMPGAEVTVTANVEFTDTRDNKIYVVVTIGSQTWMGTNLDYQPTSGNSWCYSNSNDSCHKYGRLYDWATAMGLNTSNNSSKWNGSDIGRQGVCPSGWHLPSRQEWGDLAIAAGATGTYGVSGIAGRKLKSISGWPTSSNGTDDYGFSALPGGYYYDGTFNYAGNIRGYWWTATEVTGYEAYVRYMDSAYEVGENNHGKKGGYSIRCVQND